MASIVFYDKAGGSETLSVTPGMTLREALRMQGVPVNSVITRLNGTIVDEEGAVVGPNDFIELSQVRHYDLGITRHPQRKVYATPGSVYSKSVVFDDMGNLEVRTEQFDDVGFIRFIEHTFVDSIKLSRLLEGAGPILVGLSGGRDSVAFLKLLERTRDLLPDWQMIAATVTGLPDWEEPATFEAAQRACSDLGIEHVVIDGDAIRETFHLRRPYVEVMSEVVGDETSSLSMVISHHVLRRMLEIEATKHTIRNVALGLNADDLVSTLVTWFTSGFRMGAIPIRPVGRLTYLYPLYQITKKELTLYLELSAPQLNRQGVPGRFTTGPGERSLAYAVTDHLFDLWPGINFFLFDAFSRFQKQLVPPDQRECRVCGGTYLAQEGLRNPLDICDVCDFFARHEFTLGYG